MLRIFGKKGKGGIPVIAVTAILGLTLLALGTSGCYRSTLEEEYGWAVEYNNITMMAKPPDPRPAAPATGLTPQAATNEMESYNKTFSPRQEKKPATVSLGVTGGAFGGGGQ